MSDVFHVKVREKGARTWAFLGRKGTNRLRVHALILKTGVEAQLLIDESKVDNPDWDWRVVDAAGNTVTVKKEA